MQSSLKPIAVGASVAAIAASLLVGPASATPAALRPAATTMVLSLQPKDGLLLGQVVTLGCETGDGPAGTHPGAEQACSALAEAGGDFARLQAVEVACPMIYQPVTARASGRWQGHRIQFEAEFANTCVAAAMSQDVFRF